MCARYFVDDLLTKRVQFELKEVGGEAPEIKEGDLHPTEKAPVIWKGEDSSQAPQWGEMTWGFPMSDGRGLIINARSETSLEKPTFREAMRFHRLVLPAARFYEWDGRKEKVTYSREDEGVMYLAGIFAEYAEGRRFIILTAQAPEEIRLVHERLPLILKSEDVEDWINDLDAAVKLLDSVPPTLKLDREYEQQVLPII